MRNKTLIFKKVPNGLPVPGVDLVIEDRPIDLDAQPPPGGSVVEILYTSFDPYLRGKMRAPTTASYSAAFTLDGPVWEDSVVRILKSDNAAFAVGDLALAYLPIAEFATVPADHPANRSLPGIRPLVNPLGLDLPHFLGALGMPGLTAYSSLHRIGKPKAGETIFVSSAAGAVGQLVGQIAKREGLRVVGSVGSQEKLDFILNELGFDAGFNYKTETAAEALPRLAPKGIDIYYENVGGEQLEAALTNMNLYGRIVMCGMISDYNKPPEKKYPIRNLFLVIGKQLTMQGFIVGNPDFGPAYTKEHQENVQKWLKDGTFKAKLSITDGMDHAAEGFVGVLEGKNFGKAVLKVKA